MYREMFCPSDSIWIKSPCDRSDDHPFSPFHIHCKLSTSCNHPVKADVQGSLNGCWKSSGHYYSGRCPVQGLWHGNMLLTCGTGLLGPQPLVYALNQQQEHNINYTLRYLVQCYQYHIVLKQLLQRTASQYLREQATRDNGTYETCLGMRMNSGEYNSSAATVS